MAAHYHPPQRMPNRDDVRAAANTAKARRQADLEELINRRLPNVIFDLWHRLQSGDTSYDLILDRVHTTKYPVMWPAHIVERADTAVAKLKELDQKSSSPVGWRFSRDVRPLTDLTGTYWEFFVTISWEHIQP